MIKTHKVSRVEIIDQNGRAFVRNHVKNVVVSMQDGDKTMKIFLENLNTPNKEMDDGMKGFINSNF